MIENGEFFFISVSQMSSLLGVYSSHKRNLINLHGDSLMGSLRTRLIMWLSTKTWSNSSQDANLGVKHSADAAIKMKLLNTAHTGVKIKV